MPAGRKRMTRGVVRGLALVCAFTVTSMSVPLGAAAQPGQAPPPAQQVTPDPWPRTITVSGVKYSLYQPQLDKWDGYDLEAHAAVSVVAAGAKAPIFGVIEITAKTTVARASRTVQFTSITVQKATFPSAPQQAAQYQQGFQTMATSGRSTMSLDRLEAMLAIQGAEKKARMVPVKNDPPKIVFSKTAAVLVPIDGEPVWRPVPGTGLERVLNTRPLVLRDTASGRLYLHLLDGFLEAPALAGPWTLAKSVPPDVSATAAKLAKEGVVDLMAGPSDDKDPKKKPSLKNGVPATVVATTPTELIVTDGAPDWVPIENSSLVYVKNTTGNVFLYMNDQKTYILVAGRWFRGAYLTGPWEYVAGRTCHRTSPRWPTTARRRT